MGTQIALAPAAGAGIGKMLADQLLSDPDFVPDMLGVAKRGLKAHTHRWIAESRETIEVPDFKVQAQFFFGLLAHMEGEPVKRIIHQHLGGDGQIDLGAALRDSPALQAALERQLENARFKDRKRSKAQPKPAELIVEE